MFNVKLVLPTASAYTPAVKPGGSMLAASGAASAKNAHARQNEQDARRIAWLRALAQQKNHGGPNDWLARTNAHQ